MKKKKKRVKARTHLVAWWEYFKHDGWKGYALGLSIVVLKRPRINYNTNKEIIKRLSLCQKYMSLKTIARAPVFSVEFNTTKVREYLNKEFPNLSLYFNGITSFCGEDKRFENILKRCKHPGRLTKKEKETGVDRKTFKATPDWNSLNQYLRECKECYQSVDVGFYNTIENMYQYLFEPLYKQKLKKK